MDGTVDTQCVEHRRQIRHRVRHAVAGRRPLAAPVTPKIITDHVSARMGETVTEREVETGHVVHDHAVHRDDNGRPRLRATVGWQPLDVQPDAVRKNLGHCYDRGARQPAM